MYLTHDQVRDFAKDYCLGISMGHSAEKIADTMGLTMGQFQYRRRVINQRMKQETGRTLPGLPKQTQHPNYGSIAAEIFGTTADEFEFDLDDISPMSDVQKI